MRQASSRIQNISDHLNARSGNVCSGNIQSLDALIVGAGFGGCYQLKLLRDDGLNVRAFEAGDTLGGVWCWNRYPGARVDCEFPYYGYSDPAIWNTWIWNERFPSDTELRRYFQHVSDVWDLAKDIDLNTEVIEAHFNEDSALWTIKTRNGRVVTCRWFVCATGTSFKPYTPEWKGADTFKGHMHHSTRWPRGLSIKDKRVAIIGAGSTAIQIMQEAGKHSKAVTQFIRTPNLCIPMRQRQISKEEIYSQKMGIPYLFEVCRTRTRTALPIENRGKGVQDDSPEVREAVLEEQWARGGFNWTVGTYNDIPINNESNRITYEFWKKKTRARISDPQKRELLAPVEPPYYVATKRPGLEQNYYEQADKPHVEITNSPITEITETGIKTEDGKSREFDIIAIATGFDAVTGGLCDMGIRGRNGLELQDKWKDGVYTHLGMMVHDYPNMFIVYGPQAPTSFTNGPPFIELQCEWIRDMIKKQKENGAAAVEPKKEAEQAWRDLTLQIANMTLAVHTNSWYMGANIPGKRREFLLFLGGVPMWRERSRAALEDWKDYDVYKSN